ncbi:HEAT repeat domain-containing protein [Streptomyces sp. NPDC088923]|uniref:HEAT repeat domain-containing protein n=1 Tax=Streptomyces sp. NPDC088923 TaxID=3365913 RepID=UPI00382902C7
MHNLDDSSRRLIGQAERLLGGGYLEEEVIQGAARSIPDIAPNVISWLHHFRSEQDWRRLEKFSEVARVLHPEGLGAILCDVLDSDSDGVLKEDLIEILGEIEYSEAVPVIEKVLRDSVLSDAPYYLLCVKCIHSLGRIGTAAARDVLHQFVDSAWPDQIRWHSAVELEIEEELGFDEDEMLG